MNVENATDAENGATTGSTDSSTNTTIESQTPPTTETAADEFDAAAAEELYGLPSGYLKDCKSADDALAAVSEFTDKTLIAGLGLETAVDEETAAAPANGAKSKETQAAGTKATETPGTAPPTDIDALRARLEMVETELKVSKQANQKQALAEIDRRLDAEIDNWKSAEYGVGANRNYDQRKAVKEFKSELLTLIAGYQATNQAVPTIEVLARQVGTRAGAFKPNATKKPANVLGTPGSNKDVRGAGEARNIHEVLARTPS